MLLLQESRGEPVDNLGDLVKKHYISSLYSLAKKLDRKYQGKYVTLIFYKTFQ